MHAQVACVVEQGWIPHKRYSIGEEKPRLRSDVATKSGRKIYMGLDSLKSNREHVKITMPQSCKSRTVTLYIVKHANKVKLGSLVTKFKIIDFEEHDRCTMTFMSYGLMDISSERLPKENKFVWALVERSNHYGILVNIKVENNIMKNSVAVGIQAQISMATIKFSPLKRTATNIL